jgi:hypothetical protein
MSERALTAEEKTDFRNCASDGLKLLGLTPSSSPLACTEAVEAYVNSWHKPTGGFFAKLFARKPDATGAALALGAVWGDQLVREFAWSWTCFQSDGQDFYCVASNDRSLAIFPTYFVKQCLDNPAADCTATLAFNMLKAKSVPALQAGSFQNLMAGVRRIVPK